jgi:hypothetical protein
MTITPLFTEQKNQLSKSKDIEYYQSSKKVFFEARLRTHQKEDGRWESVTGGFLFNGVEEIYQKAINTLTAQELNIDFEDFTGLYYVYSITATLSNDIKTYLVYMGDNTFIVKAKDVEIVLENIYIQ